jgi:hypothetical protein
MQKQYAIGINAVPQETDPSVDRHFESARGFVVCYAHPYLNLSYFVSI